MAARELKKRNWRFHKQYITWFRRLEQPKSTNEKQEEGSFVFFDYDQGWCQRKKENFIFKYKYLE